ncbi:hypothetical protein ABW19_dt0201853 [Dactylella cylindrospora]|nr:hypothetical protein ABW19_dt0201853 [Dactylella cylindrospora]
MDSVPVANPFVPPRAAHPKYLANNLDHLDGLTGITLSEKHAIRAVLLYTTNPKLLTKFKSIQSDDLKDLAQLALEGLKCLRGWGGRPPSLTNTPKATPTASPAVNSPTTPVPPRVKTLRSESAGGGEVSSPGPPSSLGATILAILDMKESTPEFSNTEEVMRSPNYSASCKERDGYYCAITRLSSDHGLQTAHIFPFSAINPGTARGVITWRFLAILLGEKLRDLILKGITSQAAGIHTPANRICLAASVHSLFDRGTLSIIPISKQDKEEPYYLDVQLAFYTDPGTAAGSNNYRPRSVDKQCSFDDKGIPTSLRNQKPVGPLEDGTVVRLTTHDPSGLPLPSAMLFQWRDYIWGVIGAAGLSETQVDKVIRTGGTPPGSPKGKRKDRKDDSDGGKGDDDDDDDDDGGQGPSNPTKTPRASGSGRTGTGDKQSGPAASKRSRVQPPKRGAGRKRAESGTTLEGLGDGTVEWYDEEDLNKLTHSGSGFRNRDHYYDRSDDEDLIYTPLDDM